MICAARTPAFVAPGLPIDTVATGTPGGICTVDSSASRPFSADESIGTPMTGSVVCAATTPPRCAASPAPTMNTFTPRPGASATSFMTRAGDRCALATVISLVMPNSFNTSTAGCIVGASESDPISISTSGIVEIWKCGHVGIWECGNLQGFLADIASVLHPLKGYQPNGLVSAIDRRLIAGAGGHDGEHAAAGGPDVVPAPRRAGVEHSDVRDPCRGVEAVNDIAAPDRPGISRRRQHHGDRHAGVQRHLVRAEIAV